MQPYLPRLEKVLGKDIHLLDTYLASEGYFAYQQSVNSKGMRLLLNTGVFYEFVPFNSDHFDEQGNQKDQHTAYTISEVMEGVDYAMVISTNAGLWRYMIGDLVRFIDVNEREIKITGRIKQFLSLVGEHLSLDNINTAINTVAEREKIDISEFCIHADHEELRQEWFIGTNSKLEPKEIMAKIDKELASLNDDYASARKYSLKEPVLTILDTAVFYQFMESIGKAGSQNKFPRVLNEVQSKNWFSFIEKKS
jgi:hypothetical protein